jgi:2-keto-4-pentenoate hydratase/2-oxohepta-3-ene-1,7-dioic acid hydratase in catechol pathway
MRIIRFVDKHGETHFGEDLGKGRAQPLDGDLYEGLDPAGEVADVKRLLAPVLPTNIFCIGLNYREHAEESNVPVPEEPIIFMKPTSVLLDPGEPILVPACCNHHGEEVDYECELAVVIGKPAKNVSESDALSHVLGYTAANDVSARHWQINRCGGQWIRGKSFDTFCPLGPALVTADEIPDPQTLAIKTLLGGEVMQSHSTSDMIFGCAHLISFLSQDTTLLPGTVILTGTPQGVGFARKPPRLLQDGDEVTIELEKIGLLTNPVKNA